MRLFRHIVSWALALFLIVIGVVVAMLGWKFFDMKKLLQEPRIEVN